MHRHVIKICGITNRADADLAVEAGADWLGFIFYPPSPRNVAPSVAAEIIGNLPENVTAVGVFVNEPPERIRVVALRCGLHRVQLHGDELPATVADLAALKPIKALSPVDEGDLAKAEGFPEVPLLVDTPAPERGGTGRTGDWSLARQLAERRRIVLAGGLRPENVAEAIAAVRPWGVDVSSGVERSRGRKEPGRVRDFVELARTAFEELPDEG